jgi:hypothetical protein
VASPQPRARRSRQSTGAAASAAERCQLELPVPRHQPHGDPRSSNSLLESHPVRSPPPRRRFLAEGPYDHTSELGDNALAAPPAEPQLPRLQHRPCGTRRINAMRLRRTPGKTRGRGGVWSVRRRRKCPTARPTVVLEPQATPQLLDDSQPGRHTHRARKRSVLPHRERCPRQPLCIPTKYVVRALVSVTKWLSIRDGKRRAEVLCRTDR